MRGDVCRIDCDVVDGNLSVGTQVSSSLPLLGHLSVRTQVSSDKRKREKRSRDLERQVTGKQRKAGNNAQFWGCRAAVGLTRKEVRFY